MKYFAARLWLPALLLTIWECAGRAGWTDPLFFPEPSRVGAAMAAMIASGEWGRVVVETMSRTAAGFALGSFGGLTIGIVIGLWAVARRSVEWMIAALLSSPKITLLPLLILALGVGELPKVLLVAIAAFVVVALQTADAVRQVPAPFVEMGRTYGAKGASMIRWIYIPAVLPHLLSAMRIALGRALGVAVSVELVTGSGGLGHMIWRGWQAFATERVYVGVATTALLGALLHLIGAAIERRLVPWKRS
jgi:ABC-type nitrate/sulfonate/bicarbonate transport system permease component